MANEIKSKFDLINIEKLSIGIKLPTKILFWKFGLGKKSSPNISPQIIQKAARFELICLLKKP